MDRTENTPNGGIQFQEFIEETSRPVDQPFIKYLNRAINLVVRMLAALMALVIFLGAGNVVYSIYERLVASPTLMLETSDLFRLFGAFLVVLIAMEIFVNITIYLRDDVIHVNIVLATALMAIARKVIILDYNEVDAQRMLGLAAIVLAMSIGYWLVVGRTHESQIYAMVRRGARPEDISGGAKSDAASSGA